METGNIEGVYSEVLERRLEGSSLYVCEIERGKEHGGVARISLVDIHGGLEIARAFSVYPLNLPSDDKIIDRLYEKLEEEVRISAMKALGGRR